MRRKSGDLLECIIAGVLRVTERLVLFCAEIERTEGSSR